MPMMKRSPMKHLAMIHAGVLCFLIQAANAEVRLARIFSDDMILQRGLDARIWGWAHPASPFLTDAW